MNYLLVMPKNLSKMECMSVFPLGLSYVSASLKQKGYNVFTANLDFHEGDTLSILRKLILNNNIGVICTSGLSPDCSKVKEVLDIARDINPKIITVVGGGIISSDPEPAMRVLGADFGVIGEGEVTICELANALDSDQSYIKISGLIFKNADNSFKTTSKRQEIADIDSIPFPDFEGFNYREWTRCTGFGVLFAERSCPFNCTFCFHPEGEKYRQRSLENVFKEIDYQIQNFGIKYISLTSELFSTKRKRIAEFCDRIKSYNISWACSLRVCDIDADLLHMMKSAGCNHVCIGLESADNSVLKSMRKGITVEQIERALVLTYEANMRIMTGFIFGDINESRETVENTLRFWQRHNDDHYINLTMISVYPGTFLYKHACETGIIKDREQFLRDGCPYTNISKLADTEYRDLISRITELRLQAHVPAKSLAIKAITLNGDCSVEYACRKCEVKSKIQVNFWFGLETICPSCGLINFIDPFKKHCIRKIVYLPISHLISRLSCGAPAECTTSSSKNMTCFPRKGSYWLTGTSLYMA